MSLITPMGPLDRLELESDDCLQSLLRHDKHQMLEGLIVEGYFRQFVEMLHNIGIITLPIALVKSSYKDPVRGWKKPAWWLWIYDEKFQDTISLKERLYSKRHVLIECTYDRIDFDFILDSWNYQKVKEPVQQYMMKKRNIPKLQYHAPAERVSNDKRYMQAFWGGLKGIYNERLFNDVVLHRLFKNCVISPFFTALWDVDNIVSFADGRLMQFEVKHKYPFYRNNRLCFGLNFGQLNVMKDLANMGINTLHMVMVKPKWNDELSPGYLLQDPSLRNKVLLIAYRIDSKQLDELGKRNCETSDYKTSFDGNKKLKYIDVPVEKFHVIGTLDTSIAKLAQNIVLAANGSLSHPVTAKMLEDSRINENIEG